MIKITTWLLSFYINHTPGLRYIFYFVSRKNCHFYNVPLAIDVQIVWTMTFITLYSNHFHNHIAIISRYDYIHIYTYINIYDYGLIVGFVYVYICLASPKRIYYRYYFIINIIICGMHNLNYSKIIFTPYVYTL